MVKAINTVANDGEAQRVAPHLNALLRALQRLDRRLERAKDIAQGIYGPESETDHYRGLYISQEEMGRLREERSPAPATPEPSAQAIATYKEGTGLIDEATRVGQWTMNDVHALRQLVPNMSSEQCREVKQRLSVLLNEGALKPQIQGPPY